MKEHDLHFSALSDQPTLQDTDDAGAGTEASGGAANAGERSGKQYDHFGVYEVIRELGSGAFGFVYQARHRENGSIVAIKTLKDRWARDPDCGPQMRAQFAAEAQTMLQFDHPRVVRVISLDDGADPPYFVQEFIDGETLAQRLLRGRPTLEETLEYAIQIADGLAHIHSRERWHRDLKPANILLDRQNQVHLADFGLALDDAQRWRSTRSPAGTFPYMAPEQIRGATHLLNARCDLWALGVILYEMLSGKRPFQGETRSQLSGEILERTPTSPREIIPDVPRKLNRICMQCLSKRDSDRPDAVADLREDLREVLAKLRGGDESTEPGSTNVITARSPSSSQATRYPVPTLRRFTVDQAHLYLRLMPKSYNNTEELPELIGYWKQRIASRQATETFRIGVMVGVSGCGKSSLLEAGLVPSLPAEIVPILVEASETETEHRIISKLRQAFPLADPAGDWELADWAFRFRQGQILASGQKIVFILDQFEQWLNVYGSMSSSPLLDALHHCDGQHLQAIVCVREGFHATLMRFIHAAQVRLDEETNYATAHRFSLDHARFVLEQFGRGLKRIADPITQDQQAFIESAVEGLAESDRGVVCVRLVVLALVMQDRPWTVGELQNLGGLDGIGCHFLIDCFEGRTASEQYRRYLPAAMRVLSELLPAEGLEIKDVRSFDQLLAASDLGTLQFDDLLNILTRKLFLVTVVESDKGTTTSENSKSDVTTSNRYQLTHDYLVPSIREWLSRKQRETRKGRAELKLAERTNLWTAKPENRYLPSIAEWGVIRILTDRAKWTPPQRTMMRRACRVQSLRWGTGLAIAIFISVATQQIFSSTERHNLAARAKTAVASLNTSRGIILPPLASLEEFPRELLNEELRSQFAESTDNRKLALAYAISHFGKVDVDFLVSQVEQAPADESENFATALRHDKGRALVAITAAGKACDHQVAYASAIDTEVNADSPEATAGAGQSETVEAAWRYKARLAMLSLNLGSSSLAADMCQLRPDPIQRTVFIDEGSSWCGDLLQVGLAFTSSDDADVRSAICLVVGGVPPQQVTSEQRKAWETILTDWHQHQRDTSTHSASGWALRKWGAPLPALTADLLNEVATNDSDHQWRINSIGLTLLRIPTGEVQGENESIIKVSDNFFVGDREITVGQFQQFIDDPDYPADEKPKNWPKDWYYTNTLIGPTADHPALMVNWYDAVLFCNWLSRRERLSPRYVRTGEKDIMKNYKGEEMEFDAWRLDANTGGYRLPTNAEWEYACRAGTTTMFCIGNSETMLAGYCQMYPSKMSAICGSKLPNGWGLFDVHGNAWEWSEDSGGANRVLRGGCWSFPASSSSTAFRYSCPPWQRDVSFGLRLALSSPSG